MNKCISCLTDIASKTSPEHVLLNALGGKFKSYNQICNDCNNRTSDTDRALAQSVEVLRNLGDLQTERGTAPKIQNVVAEDGNRYDLLPGNRIVPKDIQRLKIISDDKERKEQNIQANSYDQMEDIIRGVLNKHKSTIADSEIDVDAAVEEAYKRATTHFSPAPTMHFKLSFGSQGYLRSAAKSCFVLWSECVANGDATTEVYSELRSFIIKAHLEEKETPFSCLDIRVPEGLPNKYGDNANIIWVGSDAGGRVLGYFRLFGIISHVFVLAEKGGPANKSYGLISDPWNISVRAQGAEVGKMFQYDWVASAFSKEQTSNEGVKQQISAFLKTAHDKALKAEIERIMEDTVEHVFDGNETISKDRALRCP